MREKSSIKQNILQFLDYKGISKYQFYKETGITRGVLDQNNGMSEDNTARFIAYYPEVDVVWLITGHGHMLKNSKENSKENSKDGDIIEMKELIEDDSENEMSLYKLHTDYFGTERQSIPLYEIDAAAGLATLFSPQMKQIPIDHITVPNAPKCDGAVYVRGDSMYPILKSGDIACYKTINDLDNIYYGDMHLLDYEVEGDQHLTVKYVQKSAKGDEYVRLVSHNDHYAPKDIHISCIRAIALIKLSIRYNTLA